MQPFHTIGIVVRKSDRRADDAARLLVDFLSERGCNIFAASSVDQLFALPDTGSFDLVLTLGGDGTLLGTARELARRSIPVVGINMGRLGFLTAVAPGDMEKGVAALLEGHYREEQHFLLDVEIRLNEHCVASGEALNDVVVSSGTAAQMMALELFVGNRFVYRQSSDGLIVSTPTGSTAYALSAGGPIMDPGLSAIAVVPMFPHTLSSRPLVVDSNSTIRIVPFATRELSPIVICDGQLQLPIDPGCEVYIGRKPEPLRILHLEGRDFFASCREKLGWGTHHHLTDQ